MSRFINKILFDFVNFGKNAEAERHEWRLSFSFMHVSYDICFFSGFYDTSRGFVLANGHIICSFGHCDLQDSFSVRTKICKDIGYSELFL